MNCIITGLTVINVATPIILFLALVQQSGTILAILVEGHPRIIPMKFYQHWPIGLKEEMLFKGFSIFSPSGHLVQRSGTILAILVEVHPSIDPIKFYQHWPIG